MMPAPKIIKTGWGIKQGSKVKNWKRRWFVLLDNGQLRYFEDKNSFQEKGHYSINKQTTFTLSCASSEGIPIQIVNSKRTLHINFQTSNEATSWIDGLSTVKSYL